MFVGPVLTVPLMLLAVYGIGNGKADIPIYVRALMSISYLRYGLEGIMDAIYGSNRADMKCPDDEDFCPYTKPKFLMRIMGFEDVDFTVSIVALVVFYLFFNVAAFLMIRRRLSLKTSNSVAVQYIGRFIKTHLNFSSY
jgi:ATP-binding cassette, subfamily G (WHITE), member 1